MRAMKDSGIEWVGQIPQEWKIGRVKHVYDVTLGKMLQTNPKTDEDELCTYMCAANINWRGVDLSVEKKMWFSKKDKENYRLAAGDLLVTEGGDVAVSCIWNDELPECYIQNAVHRVRPKSNASNRYLYYWLSTLKATGYIDQVCNKATLAHFTKDKLDSCIIPIVAGDDQQAIANYLDVKCAEIDALIAAKEKTNALLKERRQSIIYEAVTKGLNPDAPMKDSGIEWIGQIPEHWTVKKIKYLGTFRNGLTYSPDNVTNEESGTLVLRSSNIQNGNVVFDDNVYVDMDIPEILQVAAGDILICSRNGSRELIGKNAIIPENVKASFGAFMMIFRCGDPKYLYYILNSNVFSYYLGTFLTSTVNQLTAANFGNMKVVYCDSAEEREEIVAHLDQKCEELDAAISTNEATIQKLKEYRQSIIYEAVTGKIEV